MVKNGEGRNDPKNPNCQRALIGEYGWNKEREKEGKYHQADQKYRREVEKHHSTQQKAPQTEEQKHGNWDDDDDLSRCNIMATLVLPLGAYIHEIRPHIRATKMQNKSTQVGIEKCPLTQGIRVYRGGRVKITPLYTVGHCGQNTEKKHRTKKITEKELELSCPRFWWWIDWRIRLERGFTKNRVVNLCQDSGIGSECWRDMLAA